ncbi:MAG TPA: preprotein translocase subunit YajC [Bacteroidales bacterium]|nr:preprotein translocase subunit YajC [Bacteroidales bacterium]HNS45841.1 preprotein translocase subunit YajC [Bacteroidales bacterium]
MTTLLSILLFAPQEGAKGGGYSSLIFLVLIIVIFYLFFIRPQMKRTKEQKKYRENLKNGDRVVTIGGIHGKIIEVRDTSFIIDSEGTRLKIEKSAVAMDQAAHLDETKK